MKISETKKAQMMGNRLFVAGSAETDSGRAVSKF
jgi:hypothetical protein